MQKLIYHDRYIAFTNGDIANARTGKVLSPGRMSRGYMSVSLYDGSSPKRPRSFLVHRLIAEAFLGESPDQQINHKNGDKSDNRIENLEWVTNQENIDHARSVLGKTGHGTSNGRCKLPPEVVERIKVEKWRTAVAFAKELECNVDYIRQIRRGEYRVNG